MSVLLLIARALVALGDILPFISKLIEMAQTERETRYIKKAMAAKDAADTSVRDAVSRVLHPEAGASDIGSKPEVGKASTVPTGNQSGAGVG